MALRPSLAAGLLLSERGLGRLLIVWGGLAQLQGQRAWCDNVSIGNYLFDILVKSRHSPDSRRQRCCSIVAAERCSLNRCGCGCLENHTKYMLAKAERISTIIFKQVIKKRNGNGPLGGRMNLAPGLRQRGRYAGASKQTLQRCGKLILTDQGSVEIEVPRIQESSTAKASLTSRSGPAYRFRRVVVKILTARLLHTKAKL